MLQIVAATRLNEEGFQRHTLLGRALVRLLFRDDLRASITYGNTRGLPEIFNAALASAADSDMLVFVHDDVWIDDWYLPERLTEALAQFAVVGVVGNRRRVPNQPSWAFLDTDLAWDIRENLSGAVAHREGLGMPVIWFGNTPSPVKLVDGLFLAARAKTLREKGITFDPRFPFHFYDLDFCRACELAHVEIGTWPIAITHGSGGQFGTPQWTKAYEEYLDKWKE